MKINSEVYKCNHPYYNACTLLKMDDLTVAVIQQRFNPTHKLTWWGPVDADLVNEICESDYIEEYMRKFGSSKGSRDGIYPTVTVRQLRRRLKMKPLPREIWETRF